MKNIGRKLKEIRVRKGLSQEDLADLSNVSLRTIQRIELNQNEPRGNTLQLICKTLGVNIEDILDYGKEEKNDFLIYFHLSVISMFILPLGNIILPLILWLVQKDKIIDLEKTGKAVIYFQIVWTIFSFITFSTFIIQTITKNDDRFIYFYLTLVLYVLNVAFSITNALMAGKNKKIINFLGVIKI